MIPESSPETRDDSTELEGLSELDLVELGPGSEDPEDLEPEGPRRRWRRGRDRRYGRFRRYVVRSLGWGLAALAVVVFLLQSLVDTPWARNQARELIAQQPHPRRPP